MASSHFYESGLLSVYPREIASNGFLGPDLGRPAPVSTYARMPFFSVFLVCGVMPSEETRYLVRSRFLDRSSSAVVSRATASASPGGLFETQFLGLYSRPTGSDVLGVGLSSLYFIRPQGNCGMLSCLRTTVRGK